MLSSLKYVRIYTHDFESRPDLAWQRYQTLYNVKTEASRLAARRLENYRSVTHSCWDSPLFEYEDMRANQDEARLIIRAAYSVCAELFASP